MTSAPDRATDGLAPVLRVFAPLGTLAMGVAVGVTAGFIVFLLTAFHLIAQPAGGPPIHLISQYFPGYDITWPGACVGLLDGFVTGFIAGWLVAATRNAFVAAWIFRVRMRAERDQTHDFLDHV